MDFEEVARDLTSRRNDRKEPSLESTADALKELGRPDRDYEVILVGGTNGKGSTVEMISEMLQSLGFNVGKFTSPHLVTLRERIEVNGEIINEEDFMALYRELKEFDLTFFEFMTVAAYRYFSEKDIDYAVVEVGMGGRLDATNAADNSAAAITNVGKDHTKYLGDSREEIAREKAGIVPQNGVLIDNSEMDVFKDNARDKNTEVKNSIEIDSNGSFRYKEQRFSLPVKGEFQRENLETALTAVSEIETVPEKLEKALEDVSCPGRMEKVDGEPETILDGAHNPEALEKTIESYEEGFTCVFGAVESKDVERMTDIIERKASKIYVTAPEFQLSKDPEKIDENISISSEVLKNPEEALEKARNGGKQVVATGSLYLIGDLKKMLEQGDR